MRPSREAYHRIRWDPRLDPARFVIGYESRRPEPREVAFSAFVPDGDIPWHRILYFREGDTVVWDRRTRVDTLFESAPARAAAPRVAGIEPGGFFQPLPLHRFDRRVSAWTPVTPLDAPPEKAPAPRAEVRLATFNVLCDAFDDVRTELTARIPPLIAHLHAIDADVLALQEVSPPFLRALLAERWVREAYAVSEGPAGRNVDPHGVLLMIRLPVAQLVERRFSRSKRAVVAEVRAGGASLHVGVVHLTSDRAPNAAETRRANLEALCAALPPAGVGAPPAAILGDFNWDDGALDELVARHGFGDAWTAMHPDDPGLTFDVARNALAARTSSTQRRARLDRVFVRDGAQAFAAAEASLFATEAIERTSPALFPSDHFGIVVRARLAPLDLAAVATDVEATPTPEAAAGPKPTYHSAVVIIPPAASWPRIQAIRLAHDSHAERWMPHVTLLYGFVPEASFEDAREAVEEAVRAIEPFEVTLSGIGTFAQRQSATVWAKPDAEPAGSLHALQAALERAFPQCDEQSKKSPTGYSPHLTLAQVGDHDPAGDALVARWRAGWTPIRFPVREVALIARRGDAPFEVRHVIPLGAGPPLDPRDARLASALGAMADEDDAARRAAIGHLQDACVAALPEDDGRRALQVTGAARLGIAEAGADVDAIAVGPDHVSREAFFATAREWLEVAGGSVRIAGDAVAPVLRGVIAGAAIDLGYAALPEDLLGRALPALTTAEVDRLDPASRNAVAAVRDAASVRSAVAARRGEAAFRVAVRALKRWARARGLYSNAFGYLSGFGWTLLAAWGLAQEGEPSASAALAHALDVLGACDPAYPVTLTKAAAAYSPRPRDILVLPSPAAPARNVARNVTRATAAVLRAEARRAASIVAGARREEVVWGALFEPFDRRAQAGPRLSIGLAAPVDDEPALSASAGWVEGHVLGLLLDLETGPAARPRPDPRRMETTGAIRWEILLGDDAVDVAGARGAADRFAAAFAGWEARPAGASLTVEVREGPIR